MTFEIYIYKYTYHYPYHKPPISLNRSMVITGIQSEINGFPPQLPTTHFFILYLKTNTNNEKWTREEKWYFSSEQSSLIIHCGQQRRIRMDMEALGRKLGLAENKTSIRKAKELRRLSNVHFDSSTFGVVCQSKESSQAYSSTLIFALYFVYSRQKGP